MKARHKRFLWIALALLVVAAAVTLVLRAFNSNIVLYINPTEVAQKKTPKDRNFRIGGMVTAGSLKRQPDGLTVKFSVTDMVETVPVSYTGILPDLFKEGKGVVAEGRLEPDGVFRATEVLAKHDENYMPPAAADALKKAGRNIDGSPIKAAPLVPQPATEAPAKL